MFNITQDDASLILHDYEIASKIESISELQRYHYERDDPGSKYVRLIVKVVLDDNSALVIRFKNEKGVTSELIECQCRFADVLRQNGINTPTQYRSCGRFANRYIIGGYDVIVTIESFVNNEIKIVDEIIAKKNRRTSCQNSCDRRAVRPAY